MSHSETSSRFMGCTRWQSEWLPTVFLAWFLDVLAKALCFQCFVQYGYTQTHIHAHMYAHTHLKSAVRFNLKCVSMVLVVPSHSPQSTVTCIMDIIAHVAIYAC